MQEQSSTAITSKLNSLLRLGLVSKNNMARAITVFKNPEKAMTNASNRMLMQDLLMDVMDRILNNKLLYSTIRQNLIKEPMSEGVEDERAKILFRSGLVKKKDIMLARRAITNHNNLKSMSAVGVYREMMIGMLDSMVKKITGNPILFNAFKRTLGTETVEESFVSPNAETISELFLDVDGVSLRETNKPTDSNLWSYAKTLSKTKLPNCSTECVEGWATKWYNENGGDWVSVNTGKTFFTLRSELDEASMTKEAIAAQAQAIVRLKLNPKKKIGYQVHSVGPDRKLTLDKSVDWPEESKKKSVKEATDDRTQVAKIDNLEELNRETLHNYAYRARDNAKELESWGKTYGSSDKDRLKIKNRKKGMKKALKKLGHNFIEMAQTPNRKWKMKESLEGESHKGISSIERKKK